jgi:methyl-accepting chemotaxis protein
MKKLRLPAIVPSLSVAFALTASLLACIEGSWIAGAIALAAAALAAASAAILAKAVRESSSAQRALIEDLARARGADEERRLEARAIGAELEISAGRSASLLHRLEGLASGTSDGIKVLNDSLASAVGDQRAALDAYDRVKVALDSFSSEVAAESGAVKDMVGSLGKLASWSREKNAVARSLLARAAEAEARLLEIGKASDRMVAAAKNTATFNESIADLADRTNLLALNASVEAAHAGSAGKGFAVVAAQVRSLSEESQKSSQSISSAIEGTLRSIGDTASAAGIAADYFRTVVAEIKEISSSFETILSELAELSEGSDRITSSIETVSKLSEDSEASLRGSSESMGRSRDSLGIVKDIAVDIGRDSGAMMEAFKENLAEADRMKAIGAKALG